MKKPNSKLRHVTKLSATGMKCNDDGTISLTGVKHQGVEIHGVECEEATPNVENQVPRISQ